VLLFANHASNWDGFLCRTLQKKLRPGAPTFSLMLERELQRLPLFRKLGGIGVEPGSGASLSAAVREARALRAKHPEMFLTVFPQGKIFPAYGRPLGFQGGLAHFARALAPVTLLPVAFEYQMLRTLRPQAFVSVGEPIACDDAGRIPAVTDLEDIQVALLGALQRRLAESGEDFGGFA
jgi:1-acyl-sn-glycerol-3-phosphate acyltransferase